MTQIVHFVSCSERLSYFAAQNGVARLQSNASSGKIFETAGGVVPWLDSAIPTPVKRSGTPVSGAPNLVFILLDDVVI